MDVHATDPKLTSQCARPSSLVSLHKIEEEPVTGMPLKRFSLQVRPLLLFPQGGSPPSSSTKLRHHDRHACLQFTFIQQPNNRVPSFLLKTQLRNERGPQINKARANQPEAKVGNPPSRHTKHRGTTRYLFPTTASDVPKCQEGSTM